MCYTYIIVRLRDFLSVPIPSGLLTAPLKRRFIIMKWSLREALKLTDKEVDDALIRASRIEEKGKVDGKYVYVPLTEGYSLRNLRSITFDGLWENE